MNNQRISSDRFGRPMIIVGLKDKKGNGFPKAYATLQNKMYKFEVTASNKDGVESWLKITKIEKKNFTNF